MMSVTAHKRHQVMLDTSLPRWRYIMPGKMQPTDDRGFRACPLTAGTPLTSIGELGWNALRHLEYPVLVLHEDALVHNITTMADYCRRHRVELAPHAKTSLSPQLIRRQIEVGAWGATAATAAQVRGLLAIGVPRILLANLLVDPVAIRWIGLMCSVSTPASPATSTAWR